MSGVLRNCITKINEEIVGNDKEQGTVIRASTKQSTSHQVPINSYNDAILFSFPFLSDVFDDPLAALRHGATPLF